MCVSVDRLPRQQIQATTYKHMMNRRLQSDQKTGQWMQDSSQRTCSRRILAAESGASSCSSWVKQRRKLAGTSSADSTHAMRTTGNCLPSDDDDAPAVSAAAGVDCVEGLGCCCWPILEEPCSMQSRSMLASRQLVAVLSAAQGSIEEWGVILTKGKAACAVKCRTPFLYPWTQPWMVTKQHMTRSLICHKLAAVQAAWSQALLLQQSQ